MKDQRKFYPVVEEKYRRSLTHVERKYSKGKRTTQLFAPVLRVPKCSHSRMTHSCNGGRKVKSWIDFVQRISTVYSSHRRCLSCILSQGEYQTRIWFGGCARERLVFQNLEPTGIRQELSLKTSFQILPLSTWKHHRATCESFHPTDVISLRFL